MRFGISLVPGVPVAASLFILFSAAANAIEPGDYDCEIEKAQGVKAQSGRKIRLSGAPASFTLSAANGPIFGDELLTPPRALDVYEAERAFGFVARSPAQLFSKSMTGLRSSDGSVYSRADVTIMFLVDERFIAYGLLNTHSFAGVAIYSGACKFAKSK